MIMGFIAELNRLDGLVMDSIISKAEVSVTLDVAFVMNGVPAFVALDHAILALLEGTAADAKVLKQAGPAGGWPVVEFTGTPGEIATILTRYFGSADDADAHFAD